MATKILALYYGVGRNILGCHGHKNHDYNKSQQK